MLSYLQILPQIGADLGPWFMCAIQFICAFGQSIKYYQAQADKADRSTFSQVAGWHCDPADGLSEWNQQPGQF